MNSRLREDDDARSSGRRLADEEFHGLLEGAALDDGEVHAGSKRCALTKLSEAFTMTTVRANELTIHAHEMNNVIV